MDGSIARITLTKGYVAIIDAPDVSLVQGKWCADVRLKRDGSVRTVYARKSGGLYLHRVILNAPLYAQVDHLDGNGLNCRRKNLRIVNSIENSWNSRTHCNNTSGFKGVSMCKKTGRWVAFISVLNRSVYIGTYNSKDEAALAYADASVKYHGNFGRVE